MQAALFYAPNDVRYEALPEPTPGPGELVVAIGSALTCGTDLKCYRRGHPVLLASLPSPFGHEFAGTVTAVGEGAPYHVGDRVVCANSAPCMACYWCEQGQHNLCEKLSLLNGAYADAIKVPAEVVRHNTHKLPDELPFEVAAFTEPLAVAWRGIDVLKLEPGEHVAIIGLGAIGQLMVWLAGHQGARVTAMARNPMRREVAQRFGGADAVVDISGELDVAAIREAHTEAGRGFDVVIEAVGRPETWQAAIGLVRRGGRVNLFGGCPGGTTIPLDTRRIHYDEITLVSSFHHTPKHVKEAFDLLASKTLDPLPLVFDHMAMSQVPEALERVERGEVIKIALVP